MKYVQFTDIDGNSLFVNPTQVTSFHITKPSSGTTISLCGGGFVVVTQDPDSVLKALENA